ncbi:hypothetical protein [Heyndrickxia oleronia]|uniref:hypothetical protein n=1 Tax=Heyndrickxia oleronia TaxID=38875 RepID=UPI001C0F10F5|nr:hypothetical protein [Heyndrickxia oleronia]MBU5213358.1 hypothetical protein [Heyndrickxia oleronia]
MTRVLLGSLLIVSACGFAKDTSGKFEATIAKVSVGNNFLSNQQDVVSKKVVVFFKSI